MAVAQKDGSLPFFLKVCKNSYSFANIFGGLSTAFKVDGCFADSLDRQVPTLMLLRKLVAQKRCLRKFPRCFLPQNSGDGLSQKFVAGLGLEIPFQGIPSLVLGPGLLNYPSTQGGTGAKLPTWQGSTGLGL